MAEKEKRVKRLYPVKKCPECFTILGINDSECFSCGQKVEEPDERGIAKKPVDYKGYSVAVISWAVFFVFLWLMGWSNLLIKAWTWLWGWIEKILAMIWDWVTGLIWILWEWITKG